MARHFGVLSDTSGLSGIVVNNYSVQEATDSAEARGTKGEVIDQATYSLRKTFNIDGVWEGGSIHAGTKITVGGTEALVTDCTKTEANTDFQKASLTAVKADSATLWDINDVQSQTTINNG